MTKLWTSDGLAAERILEKRWTIFGDFISKIIYTLILKCIILFSFSNIWYFYGKKKIVYKIENIKYLCCH